ncbi:lantibiotic dehydratase [Actinacidiphila paucisporea]|uniref:Lantibiotic dehydratase, C terminus n=1 Tax=Actinacidiphila paucisporea TaxID=310782 RepID=A0A1M7K901_9ACTN|nr:lantibiotic dehydratase [Actinacidiphila paucisporea]SHM61327.1 Lantibiotic dehydratase, C terminus [Actinacidiphila paucisporea]
MSVNAAAQDTGDSPRSWLLHRRFMLRVAGLPVSAVHRLRSPGARRWAGEVLAAEQHLASIAAELNDPLTVLVKDTEDGADRRAVLALRRQVFNDRLPHDPDAVRALAAAIGGGTGELLAGWLDARLRLEQLRGAGGPLLERELAAGRAELRRLAGEDRLRLALALASPTLDGQLDAFIADRTPVPDKRARKKERSLLAYLYRTACKTSPFSTFTAVAEGTFGDTGPEVRTGETWTSHPRLNVVVLARLAELIAADIARRDDLFVTLPAGWELDEDRIRYVRRSVTAGDDSAAVSFDAAHDRLFFLRNSGILERLTALFRDRPRLRYAELTRWLTTETGSTGEQAAHYAATLLDLEILQMTGLATDVHTADPLESFRGALRALDRGWAADVADRLEGPASCVDRYRHAGVAARRALLAELRRDLLALQADLGAATPSLPQTLLYEDVREEQVAADLDEWTELAAAPLHALTGMMPAFDVALPQRLTLKGFFLARYGRGGRCDDLLRLVHDFHEDIFTQYLQFTSTKSPWAADGSHAPEENWLGMPEVAALDKARAEFTGRMRDLWAAHPEGEAELRLGEDLVAAISAELDVLGPSFAPHSHFLQLARRPGDPLVVLNNSYGGLSFPFTRFTHCFDDATGADAPAGDGGLTGRLRETLRGWQPPGAVFAEITAGSATTNLNLHGRLTDYEIVCPGESSTAPADARIDLDDLYAEHDQDADRLVLRSRRLGAEVVPLYLGYLVPMVLPEVPRTLLLLSPTSRASFDVWRGVAEAPGRDGVSARPRVRFRSVVLHRRSWTAAPGALPVREPGMDDAAFYLRWQRWRRDHGLPDRVFATLHRERDDGAGGFGAVFGGSKPQYVDFDSPLSLIALDALTGGGGTRTVFEEMLPGEDELHVRSPRGHHVAELAVEIVPRAADHAAAARPGRQDSVR